MSINVLTALTHIQAAAVERVLIMEANREPFMALKRVHNPTQVTRWLRIRWSKGRLTSFVDSHRLVWDLVMGALTVVYVVLALRQDFAVGAEGFALWALAFLFIVEFTARCYDAANRAAYVRGHWLDLVTAIPIPNVPGLRILRLFRLLRLTKVGMLLRQKLLARGWTDTSLIWPTLFLFWLASALSLWLVEHDAAGAHIQTFSDAMTAAFITASTLGFGNHELPVTVDGQIISALIVFASLGLWGFASGRLTELWLRGGQAKIEDNAATLREELVLLRREIAVLTTGRDGERRAPRPRRSRDSTIAAPSD
jgi:voltage-gated potassium channel